MIDVAEAVAAINAQGYTIIPDALSPSHVESLSEAMDRARAEDVARFGEEYLYRIGQEGFIINVADRGAAFERLLMDRPVSAIVDALLGVDSFLYLFQGVIVPPGGGLGAYPWKWHCDLYHVMRDTGDRTFIPGLNCLFFIDSVNSRNGGTWIIPGSQGLLSEDVPSGNPEFMSRGAFQVEASAGSAVIFNPLLWHCAGANTTDRPRRAVKMLMVREWLLPQMDYARSVRAEVLERMDEEALRTLGHRSRVPRSFEEVVESVERVMCRN
jgi:ectoine hydroxylase-related dioxygenase (phytanoyl-CoA dioxygenase family)